MATGLATRLDSKRVHRWRSVLAALISLALALSFLHGLNADDDDGVVTVEAAQMTPEDSGKSVPDWGAPHGDHCLAHVSAVALRDNATPIKYVTRLHPLADVLAPKTADLATPFKPPRA
jgi:hypothetical protein